MYVYVYAYACMFKFVNVYIVATTATTVLSPSSTVYVCICVLRTCIDMCAHTKMPHHHHHHHHHPTSLSLTQPPTPLPSQNQDQPPPNTTTNTGGWAQRRVEGAADFAPGSRLWNVLSQGYNLQVRFLRVCVCVSFCDGLCVCFLGGGFFVYVSECVCAGLYVSRLLIDWCRGSVRTYKTLPPPPPLDHHQPHPITPSPQKTPHKNKNTDRAPPLPLRPLRTPAPPVPHRARHLCRIRREIPSVPLVLGHSAGNARGDGRQGRGAAARGAAAAGGKGRGVGGVVEPPGGAVGPGAAAPPPTTPAPLPDVGVVVGVGRGRAAAAGEPA